MMVETYSVSLYLSNHSRRLLLALSKDSLIPENVHRTLKSNINCMHSVDNGLH